MWEPGLTNKEIVGNQDALNLWNLDTALLSFLPKLTEVEISHNLTLCDSPRNKQSLHNYYVLHKRNLFHSRGCRLTEGLTDCINGNSVRVGSNPQTMYRATFTSFSRLTANLLLTVPHIVTHTFQYSKLCFSVWLRECSNNSIHTTGVWLHRAGRGRCYCKVWGEQYWGVSH